MTDREKVLGHKLWQLAIEHHKTCLEALFTGDKTKQNTEHNKSFDCQTIISSETKVPLYMVGCLVRSNYNN